MIKKTLIMYFLLKKFLLTGTENPHLQQFSPKKLIDKILKDFDDNNQIENITLNLENKIANIIKIRNIHEIQNNLLEKFKKSFKGPTLERNDKKYIKGILDEKHKEKNYEIISNEDEGRDIISIPKEYEIIGFYYNPENNEYPTDSNGTTFYNEKEYVLEARGGISVEIGESALNDIKNYFIPNLINFFQNIYFEFEYKNDFFKIFGVNIEIPIYLLEDIKDHIVINLDEDSQSVLISLVKLPFLTDLKVEITDLLGVVIPGNLYIATVIDLIEIKLSFKRNPLQNFFKPELNLKLLHFELDNEEFEITSNINFPKILITLVQSLFQTTIFENIKETIKEYLPKKISPLINEQIKTTIKEYFPIGNENENLSINVLCTKKPRIKKNSIIYFISGEFFFSNQIYIPKIFKTTPLTILKNDNNFDLALNIKAVENFLKLYMGKIENNTFKTTIGFIEWSIRVCLKNIILKIEENNFLKIENIFVKFFKDINSFELGTGINIHLKLKIDSINFNTGKIKVFYKAISKYEGNSSYINSILDFLAKSILPTEFNIGFIDFPLGMRVNDIEVELEEESIHLRSNVSIGKRDYMEYIKEHFQKKIDEYDIII